MNRIKHIKNFAWLLVVVMVFFVCAPVYAAPIRMKISMGDPDSHFNLVLMKKMFKEQIEKGTKGAIKVEIYGGGVLGSYREAIEGLQMASLEAAQVNAAALSGFSRKFDCIGLPYAFSDKKTFYKAYNGEVGKIIFATLPPVGIIGVGFLDNGFRSISNNRGPVTKPDDVKGLKIRTLESPIAIATWKAFGANPTPISYGELYTALQQKTVDAQENPAIIINEIKLQQVQKYYSLTRHQSDVDVMIMSKKFYDKLSPENQKVVMKAFADYCAAQQAMFEEEEGKAMAQIKKDGMIVNDLTPEQRKAFQDKVAPVYQQFRDEIGGELVDLILSYSKKK